MAEEYESTCKDCGNTFGYSEASLQSGSTRGLSRPERCPECRKTHSRESGSIGIPQIKIKPLGKRKPDKELIPGRLGKLSHPERIHEKVRREAKFGKPDVHIDFGITDDDIRLLIEKLHTYQVAIVVGPTGSGKSTFLPYRLMVPPEGVEHDIFTRHGQIVITQPRIQATRNIAGFVARDLHGSSLGAGFDVGFRHSGAPASDWRNKLVFVTDGTLINWIVSGQISNLSVIMIDEAHERSLNIDLILGLLKRQLPRFPQLKLIIASATINAELFLNFFGGPNKVALLKFKGIKQHKVDAFFPDYDDILKNDRYVTSRMAEKVREILLDIADGNKSEGDTLGFLPGEALIEDCAGKLREMIAADPVLRQRAINIYPLYARLPIEQQDLALAQKVKIVSDKVLGMIRSSKAGNNRIMALLLDAKAAAETCETVKKTLLEEKLSSWTVQQIPAGIQEFDSFPNQVLFTTHADFKYLKNPGQYTIVTDRRVIISTNIAETSLTVDGIVYVVDSGLINVATWDGDQSASDLQKDFHSRAGCIQRMGRAGRVRDGEAHMLYTDAQFEDNDQFTAYTVPEIQRSSIDQVILKAKAAGVNSIENFDWIEPPPPGELKRAPVFLESMGALDEDGDITDFGLELESFITDVPIAGLMVAADTFACGIEMATVAALLPLRVQGGLMEWNRDWDAESKSAIQQIRANLAAPCRDDLEFLLKLYSAHAEAESPDEQEVLHRLFFINTNQMCNKVATARDKFLEMLAIGKKSQEDRPVNFAMLDRLRIVLLDSLPDNFIYRTGNKSKTGFLTLDGREAAIQISDESILAANPPEVFISLKRRIDRTKEGTRALFLSALIRIEPTWLEFRKMTPLNLAMEIHKVLEPQVRSDLLGFTRHRLFLDINYPMGATFQISKDENGKPLAPVKRANPPFLVPVIVDGKRELPLEPDDLSVNETELFPQGRRKSGDGIVLDLTDPDVPTNRAYEADPLDYLHDDDELSDNTSEERAETPAQSPVQQNSSLMQTDEIRATAELTPAYILPSGTDGDLYKVSDYEIAAIGNKVLFETASPAVGDGMLASAKPVAVEIVRVRPIETIEFPNGEKSLRVAVNGTGKEFTVDSQSLSFSGRWELVDAFRKHDEFEMQVDHKSGGAIRLTCLPIYEERMRRNLATVQEGIVQARIIAEPRKNRFTTVLLDYAQSPAEVYWGAQFTRHNEDRTNYQIGNVYKLMLDRNYGDADAYLPAPPPELLDFVEKEKMKRRIFWNRHRTSLHTRAPMTSETREKLLALSKIREHVLAVKKLYLESNRIRLYLPLPYKGNKLLEQSRYERDSYSQYEVPDYKEGESLTGRVVSILERNVLVKLDRGGIGSIGISNLSSTRILDPREVVYADQEIEIVALDISRNEEGNFKMDLQLKGAERPRRRFPGLQKGTVAKPISLDRALRIPEKKIGLFLGKGCSHLNKVKEQSECLIQWNDEGAIFIRGKSDDRLELATAMIRELIPEMEIITT